MQKSKVQRPATGSRTSKAAAAPLNMESLKSKFDETEEIDDKFFDQIFTKYNAALFILLLQSAAEENDTAKMTKVKQMLNNQYTRLP